MPRRSSRARDAGLIGDLEYARRWLLSALAEEAGGSLEEIVAIVEELRDDRPALRAGTDQPDPVVVRLCRPFTVLGARLRRLPRTALLVLEPGLAGGREPPPVIFVVSSGEHGEPLRWRLDVAGPAGPALAELRRRAGSERERLLSGEMPVDGAPSDALRTPCPTTAWGCCRSSRPRSSWRCAPPSCSG